MMGVPVIVGIELGRVNVHVHLVEVANLVQQPVTDIRGDRMTVADRQDAVDRHVQFSHETVSEPSRMHGVDVDHTRH